jgi:hypothetical protein
MNETEKDLQRYAFLLSCLGIVVMAGHGATSQPWCVVLGTRALFVGLRYAQALTAGSMPVTGLLAVLLAALIVSGGLMIFTHLLSLGNGLVHLASDIVGRPGGLTNFVLWAGRSAGFIVLIVIIALVLLRLAAARTTTRR